MLHDLPVPLIISKVFPIKDKATHPAAIGAIDAFISKHRVAAMSR